MKNKRVFAILLTVAMLFAMIPSAAFATGSVPIRTGTQPPDGGDVPDSAYYTVGSLVSLLAEPKSGYYFECWYDYQDGIDFLTKDNPYVFRAETARTLVASFRKFGEYTLASPEFATSPGSHEDGILGVSPVKSSYKPGEVVTLTATPGEGYRFRGFAWGEDTGGSSADVTYEWLEGNTFTIPSFDSWLRAVFYKIVPHTLTVNTSEHVTATLTPQQETYLEGDEVTLTLSVDDGYIVTIDNLPAFRTVDDGVYTFDMIDDDLTITITAREKKAYRTSFIKSGEGTVQAGLDEATGLITATAEAAEGYQFLGWYNYNDSQNPKLLSANNPYSFVPAETMTVLAIFCPPLYTVNKATNITNGTLEVSPDRSFYFGDETITLIGHPDDGYAVNAYYYAPVSNLSNLTELTGNTFQMPEESVAVTVVFARVYAIGASPSPAAGGTVSGGGSYRELSSATLTATPEDGYRFVNWTEGGNAVSTDAEYTFTVTGTRDLVAHFAEEHTVALTADPSNGGSVSGGGTYGEGDSVTVTASPSVGYRFVNWTEGGAIVSTTASYTFNLTGDRTLVAHFADAVLPDYAVSASVTPSAGGSVTGAGKYAQDTSAMLTANPATGYEFVNWTEDGAVVSTSATYLFTVTGARTLVAHFAPASAHGNLTGSGTSSDPYRISTALGLAEFCDIVNGTGSYATSRNSAACAVLENDIDLDNAAWTPILGDPTTYYTGTFDGQNNRISGLNVVVYSDSTDAANAALFRIVGYAGVVKNLRVSGVASASALTSNAYAAGIVSMNFGAIENCQSDVTVTASVLSGGSREASGGGIAGSNWGSVSGCSNYGTVTVNNAGTGTATAGGIVESSIGATVTNCFNGGAVTATGGGDVKAGGIIATNNGSSTVTNCCSTGAVSSSQNAGGSAAYATSIDALSNCYHNKETTGVTEAVDNGYGDTETATVKGLTAAEFLVSGNFNGFDFTNTWIMTDVGPRLRSTIVQVSAWAELQNALSTAGSGSTITLSADVIAGGSDATLVVPAGQTVILDLNGHAIDRHLTTGKENGYVIRVDGNLTVTDSSGNDSGKITGGYNSYEGYANGAGVYVTRGGYFRLNGGKITGNTLYVKGGYWGGGAGVYFEAATFEMNGGAITGNTSTGDYHTYGGGIRGYGNSDAYCTFIMNGGTISNNGSGSSGGGGHFMLGTVILNSGTITGNTSDEAGALCIGQNTTLLMSGGTITGNTTRSSGSGSLGITSSAGSAQFSGDPVIADNTGGNVYLANKMLISVTGTLDDNARIGVTMRYPGVMTSGLSGNGTLSNFFSDDTSRSVSLNENGEAALSVNVTLNPGDHMTRTGGGDASQSVPAGSAITAVVFTAEEGYCFPTDYAASSYGISVTRDSVSQITVSGAPSRDVTLNLPAPGLKGDAATPQLVPVQPAAINGTGSVPTTTAHEYSTDGTNWTACTGETAGLAPGTYYVRVKATETNNASPAQTITIDPFVPTQEDTPVVTFTATGPNCGTLAGLAASQLHVLNGAGLANLGILTANGNYTISAGLTAGSFTVVRKGNNSTTVDSDAQTIAVTKAETPALEAVQPAAINGTGLIPTTDAHEISTDGTNWTACTGETTGLTEGAYYVRVKANGTVLASDSQTVIINAYVAPGEEVPGAAFTATGPDSGTLTGLVAKANYTIGGAGIETDTVIFADKDGTAVIASGLTAGTLSVVKNGNTTTTVNSDARTIAITKADVPELVSAPGYIPTTNAHEYSKDGTEWLSCTGALSGLAGGTYYVRVKAAGTVLASDTLEVTVTPYFEEPAPDSEVKSGETVSAAELSQLVQEGKPLTVESQSGATVTFDTDALKGILEQANGDVTITFESEPATATEPDETTEPAADIPAGAKVEGTVYVLDVTTGGETIKDSGGTVTLEMPYELAENEKPERVTVWQYVESDDPDEPGTWVKLESAYDPETGTVSVDVDGSGRFFVGYDPFPYTDVSEDAYYYDAVDWADRLGITEGVDDDSFEPEGICLRAQMVTFLWRAAGEPEPAIDSCPFTDLDPAAYYYKAVLWAYENGITEGVGDNLFNPDGTVDRAQSIVFLFRALAAQKGVTISFVDTPFTDVPAGEYYTYAVQWAYENGVTEGTSDTTFSPDDDCRRADVVTFLYRAYAKKEEETGSDN